MADPYVQAEILLHDLWMTWVVNVLFTVLTIMNYDYIFGATASYFHIVSGKGVEMSTQASVVFSVFSSVAFTAYCYVAKEDYELSRESITSAVPVAI